MSRVDYPEEIKQLIERLRRLPGIGPRSAERMALWLLAAPVDESTRLAAVVTEARSSVVPCGTCGFFSSAAMGCPVCTDRRRDPGVICVVEQSGDVISLERSGAFAGFYHVLGGKLAPLDGVGPEDLRISELIARAARPEVHEVILAVSSDVEGEATASFLRDAIHHARPDVQTTRLAQGLPAGGGLEHADEVTLSRALAGRRAM